MPRELPPARSKMRVLRTGDVIAHWRLLEASGTAVADAAGLSALVSASAGNIVDGPFYGEAAGNKGRTTTADAMTGASTAGQRSALIGGDWSVEVWCQRATATRATVIAQGASADSSLAMQVLSTGAVNVQWTAGGGASFSSPAGVVGVGVDTVIGLRRRITGSTTCVLDIYVDGAKVATSGSLTRAVGGSTGSWVVGASDTLGFRFNGVIYDVRIAAVALSEEAFRESYSRGVRDWDVARCIESGEATTFRRALLHNGDNAFVDLSTLYDINWLRGWDDDDAVDADGAGGTLKLRRRSEYLSVAPYMTGSRANVDNPFGQALDVARRVKLEEMVVPHGSTLDDDAHWSLVFEGWARTIGGGNDPLTLTLSDNMYALQTAWCQPNRTTTPQTEFRYAATPTSLETVLAQMLTDHQPRSIAGVVEGYATGIDFAVFAPTSPLFLVDNAPEGFPTPSTMTVAAALNDLVDTTVAWFIRFRWDDTRQQFRLTLLDPGRTKTFSPGTDRTIAPSQIFEWRRLDIDDADVRNDVEIEWSSPTVADNIGVGKRAVYRVEDLASIARYRRRYCRIPVKSAGQLNTLPQVTNLAAMVLSDLAYPLADFEVEIPARRDIDLGDVVRILPDEKHTDVFVDVAVVGIAHKRNGRPSTTLTCRQASPVGRRRRYFDMFICIGINNGLGFSAPATPAAPTLYTVPGGIVVAWQPPAGFGNRRYRDTEIHAGATAGFAPSPSTRVAVVRGGKAASLDLAPGVQTFIRLIHRDDMDNSSAPSIATSATPRQLTRTAHARVRRATNQTLSGVGSQIIAWNTEDADPLGRHSAGTYIALTPGILRVDCRALYDTASKPGTALVLTVRVAGSTVATFVSPLSSGTPDRAQGAFVVDVVVAAANSVEVWAAASGNTGHFIVADAANSRCWFTPVTED